MSRLRVAVRQRIKHWAYVRALSAHQQCCGGRCTTSDWARGLR